MVLEVLKSLLKPDREAGVIEFAEKDVEKANIVNILDEFLVRNRRLLSLLKFWPEPCRCHDDTSSGVCTLQK